MPLNYISCHAHLSEVSAPISSAVRFGFILAALFLMWLIASMPLQYKVKVENIRDLLDRFNPTKAPEPVIVAVTHKCGLSKECPEDHFAFKIRSGAANVVGPKICFDGKNVMSTAMNNIGSGLNIVLLNGQTGEIIKTEVFNMYSGDVQPLLNFLKDIKSGQLILVASFDEIATKMTDEVREFFTSFGSSLIKSVKYRDNWVFVGAAGFKEKSPFEMYIKNDKDKNIYDGWPELLEMDGCIPMKT
ncbi:protein FAM3C isoform X2 [Amia ocellicauda]|uniref:protein FAM3C isoform X2 n=1 Tax=Amia ocellicauda TaxID=2972642 RepID=UPI0034649A38